MALNDLERRRIEKAVGAFAEKRRPAPHIRPKLDFGFRVSEWYDRIAVRPSFAATMPPVR